MSDHFPDATKMVSDTPRTNGCLTAILDTYGYVHQGNCPQRWVNHSRELERELNASNQRIKRLYEVATDQRNRAEKWYIEEREDGDSVSIATTRAYFLAYTEIVREILKSKEAKP